MTSPEERLKDVRAATRIGDLAGEVLDELIDRLERARHSELWDVIAVGIDKFNAQECRNYFVAAGYDHD